MYLIGSMFADRYKQDLNLSKYDPYKPEVYAMAVGGNETHQSACSFFSGFFAAGDGLQLDDGYPVDRGVPEYNRTYMIDIELLPKSAIPMKFSIIPIHGEKLVDSTILASEMACTKSRKAKQ